MACVGFFGGAGADSLAQGRMMSQLLAYQGAEDGEYIFLGKDHFEFEPAHDGS